MEIQRRHEVCCYVADQGRKPVNMNVDGGSYRRSYSSTTTNKDISLDAGINGHEKNISGTHNTVR